MDEEEGDHPRQCSPPLPVLHPCHQHLNRVSECAQPGVRDREHPRHLRSEHRPSAVAGKRIPRLGDVAELKRSEIREIIQPRNPKTISRQTLMPG